MRRPTAGDASADLLDEQDSDFGFAIPTRDALWIADQLRTHGRVDRACLGVHLETAPVSAGPAAPEPVSAAPGWIILIGIAPGCLRVLAGTGCDGPDRPVGRVDGEFPGGPGRRAAPRRRRTGARRVARHSGRPGGPPSWRSHHRPRRPADPIPERPDQPARSDLGGLDHPPGHRPRRRPDPPALRGLGADISRPGARTAPSPIGASRFAIVQGERVRDPHRVERRSARLRFDTGTGRAESPAPDAGPSGPVGIVPGRIESLAPGPGEGRPGPSSAAAPPSTPRQEAAPEPMPAPPDRAEAPSAVAVPPPVLNKLRLTLPRAVERIEQLERRIQELEQFRGGAGVASAREPDAKAQADRAKAPVGRRP